MDGVYMVALLFTAIGSLGALYVSYLNMRKIEVVHLSINSRMDQLLKTSGAAEHAAGVQQERDRPR